MTRIFASSKCLPQAEYEARDYMPALDGLRAVAVVLVITCHLHQTMWHFVSGSVGVILFFVLSGYLITRLALGEEQRSGTFHAAAFYVRRAFRILPLYFLVLAAYAVLILGLRAWPAKIQPFHAVLLYDLTYLQEIPYWIDTHADTPFVHSWSLGVEEKFYLLFPWLVMAVPRRRRLGVVLACALVCILQGIAFEGQRTYHLESYGYLLLGVTLALLLAHPATYPAVVRTVKKAFPVALTIALVAQFYLIPFAHIRGMSTVYAAAVTFVMGALVSSRGIPDRLLSTPGLVLVGKLSYGIYLVHVLCLNAVERFARPGHGAFIGVLAFLGTFLLSAGVAYLLHRIVERPLILLGRRLGESLKARWHRAQLDAKAAVLEH